MSVHTYLKARIPRSPGNETKRVGQRTDVYGFDAPKFLPFTEGKSVIRITPGWVMDRPFTPIGNTRFDTLLNSHRCYCVLLDPNCAREGVQPTLLFVVN